MVSEEQEVPLLLLRYRFEFLPDSQQRRSHLLLNKYDRTSIGETSLRFAEYRNYVRYGMYQLLLAFAWWLTRLLHYIIKE